MEQPISPNTPETPREPFTDIPDDTDLPNPRTRIDGWTPERQKV